MRKIRRQIKFLTKMTKMKLFIILFSGTFLLIIFLTWNSPLINGDDAPVWSWECTQGQCLKVRAPKDGDALSLAACRLFCGPHGSLWPWPTGEVFIYKKVLHVNVNSIDIFPENEEAPSGDLVKKAGDRFKENIYKMVPSSETLVGGQSLEVTVELKNPDIVGLTLKTDESYFLTVSETSDGRISAAINADNFFGARHGLETLSQFVIYDDIRKEIQIAGSVEITDKPTYPYRGVLLDTARNYFSVNSIKRTIEAMASSKLNTFHWHITDSQSFPLVSKSYPELTKLGAYSPAKVYTAAAIKEVIDYARIRGVRVLPEFDAPAHVGEGWQDTGLVACFNAQPWNKYCFEPPCGQLDPTQDRLYDVLEGIYGDMVEIFNPDIFHMGGDEVSLSCWNSTDNIVKWMTDKKKWGHSEADFMELWNVFQTQARSKLEKKLGKKIPIIIWTSTLTHAEYVEQYLPKDDYIIQVWTTRGHKMINQLLDKNYRLILSNYDALYLDCGFEGWLTDGNNWCAPYIGWQKIFDYLPSEMVKVEQLSQILGSEAALWSEQVDDTTIDSRLWPRAAAMAETLWTEPKEGWRAAENRMLVHRDRLVERGIQASGMQPQWCLQHQGQCPR